MCFHVKKGAGAFLHLCSLFFISLIYSVPAQAQVTNDTVVKEIDRPIREDVQERFKPVPLEVPAPAVIKPEAPTGPTFMLRKINLIGVESLPMELFTPIIEKYEDTEVSLEGLNNLTTEIEKEYLKNGIIAACFLPEQDIQDGVVTLQVVEAKMGRLIVEDHKYFRKSRIDYYWDIENDEVLRYDKLYKNLQLMNKSSDRRVTSELKASDEPGKTDVYLNVDTHFPGHAFATYDNEGSNFTGFERSGFGLRHNNLIGLDDSLISGYSFGNDFESIYGYHRIPVSPVGTTFMYGHSYSNSIPKKDYASLDLESITRSTSFFLYQDLYHDANYLGEVYAGLEAKDRQTRTIGIVTMWDRLRVWKFGGTYMLNSLNSTTAIQPEISQGVNGLGSKGRNSLSSRNTRNVFTIASLKLQHQRQLARSLQLNMKLQGQVASIKLPSSEVFYLGGIDSVRGYPSGDFFADSGVQGNLELLFPAFFIPEAVKSPLENKSLRDHITGVIFYDHGFGKKRGGQENIANPTGNLRSLGIGLRTRVFDKATVRTDWGFPIGDRAISEEGKSRFHLAFEFEY